MAYTKNSWQTGDKVTAEKLNHAEGGIETANQNALPAVTSDDNGDVLAVVEGAWAKAAPSGAGVLDVTSTTTRDVEHRTTIYTLNKTYNEIKTAILIGKKVVITETEISEEEYDGVTVTFTNVCKFFVNNLLEQTASPSPEDYPNYTIEANYRQYQTHTLDGYPTYSETD